MISFAPVPSLGLLPSVITDNLLDSSSRDARPTVGQTMNECGINFRDREERINAFDGTKHMETHVEIIENIFLSTQSLNLFIRAIVKIVSFLLTEESLIKFRSRSYAFRSYFYRID